MSTPSRRRLMKDFKRLQSDPPGGISGAPCSDNIMLWNAVIFGPGKPKNPFFQFLPLEQSRGEDWNLPFPTSPSSYFLAPCLTASAMNVRDHLLWKSFCMAGQKKKKKKVFRRNTALRVCAFMGPWNGQTTFIPVEIPLFVLPTRLSPSVDSLHVFTGWSHRRSRVMIDLFFPAEKVH